MGPMCEGAKVRYNLQDLVLYFKQEGVQELIKRLRFRGKHLYSMATTE